MALSTLGKNETSNEYSSIRIEPHYRDDKQKEYDRLIVELECKVSTGKYDYDYLGVKLKEKYANLVSNEEGALRMFQSVIELTGTVANDDQLDIALYWVWKHWAISAITVTPAKLLQQISPYLQTRSRHSEIRNKQRNLCAVLTMMAGKEKVKLLNNEVIQFLKRILIEFDHNFGLVYGISCVSAFLSCEENRKQIASSEDFMKILKDFQVQLDRHTLETFYICKFDYARYKFGFIAQWCVHAIEKTNSLGKLSEIELKSSFDPNDCNFYIKLSPDQLCIRSDGATGRIRSSYPVTCGVFYYEVILLTSGFIKVGWETKKTKIADVLHCTDKQDKHSICYDGYQNYIYHKHQWYKLKSPQLQAGDVIGCKIDVPNKKFVFYLNGNVVEGVTNGFTFSNESYFAAACVTFLQHCYCNFGQVPFKHPPPVTYRTFHGSISKYINDKLCPFCNLKQTGARFANCDHWKVCIECMAKLSKCPTCNE